MIGNVLWEHSNDFKPWITEIIHNDVVDCKSFICGIDQWFSDFVNSKAGAYAQDQTLKYLDKFAAMI